MELNDECPQYQALSYFWGDADDLYNIKIDSKTLQIRRNLYDFLQTVPDVKPSILPNGSVPSHLWIDQVCINQENGIERNHQVQQMKQIFSRAGRVIAWLGPCSDAETLRLIEQAESLSPDAYEWWTVWGALHRN